MFVQFKFDKISYSPAVWNIKPHEGHGTLQKISGIRLTVMRELQLKHPVKGAMTGFVKV
jgi:hypothetical protein